MGPAGCSTAASTTPAQSFTHRGEGGHVPRSSPAGSPAGTPGASRRSFARRAVCVEWLCRGLELIGTPAEESDSDRRNRPRQRGRELLRSQPSADSATLLWGLRRPRGVRWTGPGRADGCVGRIVYAVLDGIAQAGAICSMPSEADGGAPHRRTSRRRRDDRRTTRSSRCSRTRPADRSPDRRSIESTTRGAAALAGVADGTWNSLESTRDLVGAHPRHATSSSRRGHSDTGRRWFAGSRTRPSGRARSSPSLEF